VSGRHAGHPELPIRRQSDYAAPLVAIRDPAPIRHLPIAARGPRPLAHLPGKGKPGRAGLTKNQLNPPPKAGHKPAFLRLPFRRV